MRCAGYMIPHGHAKGRIWFVCGKCRWNPGYKDPEPAPKKPASAPLPGDANGYKQPKLV